MMEYQNKPTLLIFIAAIVVVISASLSNNYFAYLFLLKGTESTHKTDRRASSQISKTVEKDIDKSWRWNYSGISIKDNNYPIVALRNGYKAITLSGDKILMGWKYELLNTSNITSYTVTVNYLLEDSDGFVINESSSSENVRPKEISIVKQTTLVPYEDYKRIKNCSWYIKLTQPWINEKLSGTPFERAGSILKDNAPYWLTTYLTHLFMDDYPFEGDKKGLSQLFYPDKWVIAQTLGIKPDKDLIEIGNKLNIDFKKYNLPSWKEISSNPNYATLGKEDRDTLKKYLNAEKDFGEYSPEHGRKGGWGPVVDFFPEPSEQAK
jgi:hypothetical protein